MQNPEIVAAFQHDKSAKRHLFSTPRPLAACVADDPLLSIEALRTWEAALTNHTPSWDLTPHAGFVAARWLMSLVPHARQVTMLVGPGNNGTDGLWMAFELAQRGIATYLCSVGGRADRPAHQMAAWAAALAAGAQACDKPPRGSQVVVDAILGSGQTRALASDWIARMAEAQVDPTAQWWLSLDVPTGLCPRSGHLLGPRPSSHLRRATLSLVTLKPGIFMEHGPELCGDGWFSGLAESDGTWQPPALPRSMAPELRLNDSEMYRKLATPYALPRHKGENGSVWVIGGITGMEGALQLAARAALQSGPGKTWIVPLSTQGFAGPPECMTCPLERAAATKSWGPQDVLSFGCGAGDAPDTRILLNWLASAPRLVLDADGLNRIAASTELQASLRQRAQRGLASILTPHPLEAARLLGADVQAISRDRLQSARQLADAFQCTVAVKGAGTLIASPHEPVTLNPTGSPALAIGGSGDVLAGWLAGRWAQCPLLENAEARQRQAHAVCALAIWEHGRAAELPPLRHRIPGRELIERLVQLTTPAAANA